MISHTATINGIKMRWEEEGEGVAVVMVHGIPTSPALWRHVIPKISGVRCLAFEMIGYGQSIPQGRGRNISVAAQADYLVTWLKHLKLDRAIFAGHDLGGGVVQIAAVRNPGLCAGLFLTNAIGYDSWPIPSVKAMQALAPITRHLPDLVGKQILRTLMYRGHDDHSKALEALDMHWAPYAKEEGAEALVRQMQSLDVEDTLAIVNMLPHLKIPAGIVWGAADQYQKLKYGQRFATDLSAPLHVIEHGKHFTPEDHPDIIAEEIKKLVALVY